MLNALIVIILVHLFGAEAPQREVFRSARDRTDINHRHSRLPKVDNSDREPLKEFK